MIYDVSHKTLIGTKPLLSRFDKVDGFIRVYDGTKYLVLLGIEKYDAIYNKIRYLISQKSDATNIFFHNYARIKMYSYDSFHLEKALTLHNARIPIKLVFNKNQNLKYHNIFSEKCSYQSPKNNYNKS